MGLQSQLNDVSSDSVPLLLISLLANSVSYLRSILFTLLQFIGVAGFNQSEIEEDLYNDAVGSGLSGLVVLAEQLNINRILSYRFREEEDERTGQMAISDCVVCLSGLREGDQVRRLSCRHVFHKKCLDGWLDHLNFNCPLCRSPLLLDRRVSQSEWRVRGELVSWFSPW